MGVNVVKVHTYLSLDDYSAVLGQVSIRQLISIT
jgi:hypothetical protein